MPWCPKCKTEYRAGFEKCSDCGSRLVESLKSADAFDKASMLNFMYGPQDHIDTIRKFLSSTGKLKAYSVYNEKKDIYELFIKPEDQERATALVNQFFNQVNAQEVSRQQAAAQAQNTPKQKMPDAKGYRSTKERAADHKSSAIMLIILGAVGLTVIILMATGVLNLVPITGLSAIVIYSIMGAFFLMFIIMGIVSAKTYMELKDIDSDETDITKELDTFCAKNLTKEIIDAKINPLISDESQEYFYRAEFMRQTILAAFPSVNASFLEEYIDNKYGEIFE